MRFALLLFALSASGCGYALMQTAHTEPPRKVGAVFGATHVSNELSGVAGRNATNAKGAQIAPRIGIADQIDLGFQPWLLAGMRADVKYDVLDPLADLAFAPRLGFGYSFGGSRTTLALAGAIVSYRVTAGFEPYLGATFANHWIYRSAPEVQLAPGETLASRTYVGDGLVQLNLGFELFSRDGYGLLAEYGLWLPAQDDPGDSYAFVTTHVFAIGMHFFSSRPAKSSGE